MAGIDRRRKRGAGTVERAIAVEPADKIDIGRRERLTRRSGSFRRGRRQR